LARTQWQSPVAAVSFSLATTLLAAAPDSSPAQTAGRWPDEQTVGPYVCHADFRLDRGAGLLNELMQLQRDLTQTLGMRLGAEPIHLFLFGRERTYQNYVQQYFPHVPYRRALFIKERGPGMVFAFSSKELDVDLRHESTHAILHAALPMVPLWLDEGLAEYFEVPPADRAYRNPHLPKVKWGSFLHTTKPLKTLEDIGRLEEMDASAYRHAWAWVHFMLHGPPAAQDELTCYLNDIQSHTPPGQLSNRLQQRIPDLERSFVAHFTQWRR